VRALEILIVPLILVAGAVVVVLVMVRASTWLSMAGHMPDAERLQAENESMRTLTQVFGGAFVLVGLYFSAKSITMSKRDQASDRVGNALAALGSPDEAQRVGAVAVLADVLSRPSRDYFVARATLSAFVRSRTGAESYRTAHQDGPSVDVQAALHALGGRGWGSRFAPRQQRILDLGGTLGARIYATDTFRTRTLGTATSAMPTSTTRRWRRYGLPAQSPTTRPSFRLISAGRRSTVQPPPARPSARHFSTKQSSRAQTCGTHRLPVRHSSGSHFRMPY